MGVMNDLVIRTFCRTVVTLSGCIYQNHLTFDLAYYVEYFSWRNHPFFMLSQAQSVPVTCNLVHIDWWCDFIIYYWVFESKIGGNPSKLDKRYSQDKCQFLSCHDQSNSLWQENLRQRQTNTWSPYWSL